MSTVTEFNEYEDIQAAREFIFHGGTLQFVEIYHKFGQSQGDGLLWGDELESFLIYQDDQAKRVRPAPVVPSVLDKLADYSKQSGSVEVTATAECLVFVLETIPPEPYSGRLDELTRVEENMRTRREVVDSLLPKHVISMTIPMIPGPYSRLSHSYDETLEETRVNHRAEVEGKRAPTSVRPCDQHKGEGTKRIRHCFAKFGASNRTAAYEEYVYQGKYYRDLVTNTKARAQSGYGIVLPIFQDQKMSTLPTFGAMPTGHSLTHMTISGDHPVFATNTASLQVTFQARDLREAQYLYDQLAILSPILVCLTAGSPVFRGFLTDVDSRLAVATQGMDDRTPAERRGQISINGSTSYLSLRFGPVSWFISEDGQLFNDTNHAYNKDVYRRLLKDGVDRGMAMHVAILFTRDPLYLPKGLHQSATGGSTELFDLINNSTWPMVRLKIPRADGELGWRIEFRPMGALLTDFENAAFAVFIFLLTRAMREFTPNFLIPMTKALDNFHVSLSRDAVRKAKFYFRASSKADRKDQEEFLRLSVDEIVNGKDKNPGLIQLVRDYLDIHLENPELRRKLEEYLLVVSQTASGERPTTAKIIRDFVTQHAEYQQDSVVTERIEYDLIHYLKEEELRRNCSVRTDIGINGYCRAVMLKEMLKDKNA